MIIAILFIFCLLDLLILDISFKISLFIIFCLPLFLFSIIGFNHENFVLGLSFDVSSPCFQNLIFDAGVKIKIIDCINISSGWQFDVQACANEVQTWVPSIGISVKFNLDTGFTNKEKWQTSELEVSTAWKNIYDNVNAFSVGAIVNVGQPDVAAPTISIDADVEIEE